MKIHVGSGSVRISGFTNVDIRKEPEVDVVGHVGRLPFANGSAEVIFGHAVFEHVFLGHQLAVLREWKRLLAQEGRLILLALPDFRMMARLYLENAVGIVGKRFDLQNVYRYTHGEPEHSCRPIWPVWQPAPGRDAPAGYVPQLHKSLFDAGYLRDLFQEAGFFSVVFNYAFPNEPHPVNLGVIASRAAFSAAQEAVILESLAMVPGIERFADLKTISIQECAGGDGLTGYVRQLDAQRSESLSARVARKVSRILCRA
jgi:SAM-dependent methyltransferase